MENQNDQKAKSDLCKATYIARSVQRSGIEIKACYIEPKSEDEALILHAHRSNKWIADYQALYGSEPDACGVESLVYLSSDGRDVFKINSGIYHSTWLDFFRRIEAHNRYFPNTK